MGDLCMSLSVERERRERESARARVALLSWRSCKTGIDLTLVGYYVLKKKNCQTHMYEHTRSRNFNCCFQNKKNSRLEPEISECTDIHGTQYVSIYIRTLVYTYIHTYTYMSTRRWRSCKTSGAETYNVCVSVCVSVCLSLCLSLCLRVGGGAETQRAD